tara:strand:+ start:486 stop:755 length:270 start_codon:yes stop_codon:yes gene_type:complete
MKQKIKQNKSEDFIFSTKNYQILGIGMMFLVTGIVLMIGGSMEDLSNMSFRRITLAPILILIGFVINIFAILYPLEKTSEEETEESSES